MADKIDASNKQCECEICTFYRRTQAIIRDGGHRQLVALIDELMLDRMHDRDTIDHLESVMAGTWANSVDILGRALAKAKIVAAGSVEKQSGDFTKDGVS